MSRSEHPFWSVMIPVYNSTKCLSQTLSSVLSEDPGIGQMQIKVMDGHSTFDEPSLLVRDLAGDRVTVSTHAEPLRCSQTGTVALSGLAGNGFLLYTRMASSWPTSTQLYDNLRCRPIGRGVCALVSVIGETAPY
jgi:cellulose synthase/poly-beta-1,6-N-acetylglucosamine synthase-like glycosyltransferase